LVEGRGRLGIRHRDHASISTTLSNKRQRRDRGGPGGGGSGNRRDRDGASSVERSLDSSMAKEVGEGKAEVE